MILSRTAFVLNDFLKSGAIMSSSDDKLLIGWGEPSYFSLNNVNRNQPAFYFSDFFLTASQPWIQYCNWLEITKEEFFGLLGLMIQPQRCEWVIDRPERFEEAFGELNDLLQSGELLKGVPYLFSRSSDLMNDARLHYSLKQGLSALDEKKGYLYGHWDLSKGVLGVTPELLFSHDGSCQKNTVHTMALAGTCHASRKQDEFLKDEKELYEHQLVVQGISQHLQSFGAVKVGEMQLLQLPRLNHMMTPIEVDLKRDFDFDQLVNALHPTPALGAFPRSAGNAWLQNFQRHTPRHYYGAPVGFQCFRTGRSQCFVGIRNVQWDQSGMRIGAGCGVVKQSHFTKEREEIQLKIKAIQEQFQL